MLNLLKTSISLLLIFLASLPAMAEEKGKEQVVVLHGIARSSSHMEDLAAYLERKGYIVFNLDYPSTEFKMDKLAKGVADELSQKLNPELKVHFVGYSMGGLVTRAVLHNHRPENLGRVVQLASPNKGSEVADLLRDNWLYAKVYGPAGKQLTTSEAGIDALLGEVDYELGVLAGNFTIDPVSSMVIPGDDDGKVSIESTKVDGMKDHLVVSASHTYFPHNESVHKQTYEFLKTGSFKK